jgi:tyrosine-protein phosphatase SIW14
MGSHQRAPGLPNFGQVTPNLFRGAQPERDGYRTLQAMGVNIVVDMWGGNRSEQGAVGKLGMQYVSIPWHPDSPSDEIIARFLKVIEENPDKKFFVHCHAGVDRTGMAIASYRMAKEGWSPDEAMKEMQLFGFSRFHHLRLPTLVRFEKDFPEHLKTSSAFQDLQVVKR